MKIILKKFTVYSFIYTNLNSIAELICHGKYFLLYEKCFKAIPFIQYYMKIGWTKDVASWYSQQSTLDSNYHVFVILEIEIYRVLISFSGKFWNKKKKVSFRRKMFIKWVIVKHAVFAYDYVRKCDEPGRIVWWNQSDLAV